MGFYRGKGNGIPYQDYIDFINYVFGMNGQDMAFDRLLPKLYAPGRDPMSDNIVILEDGKLRAAVGVYTMEQMVCGEKLRAVGIGNVAVHPYTRSKGYMKETMKMTVEDAVSSGADFSVLGGSRHRYSYFSYESVAPEYIFSVTRTDLRHCMGSAHPAAVCRARVVTSGEDPVLDNIYHLYNAQPLHVRRTREDLWDILRTWFHRVVVFEKNDVFYGYMLVREDTVSEWMPADGADLADAVRAVFGLMEEREKLQFRVPPFRTDLMRALWPLAEGHVFRNSGNYSVFRYDRVCNAFLKLKRQYSVLEDGKLTLRIHGTGGEENLRFSVVGEKAGVIPCGDAPALELSHKEAMDLLFADWSPRRNDLPAFAAAWFPLPLYQYPVDGV